MAGLLDRGSYYGETILRREVGGVGLSETVHSGGSRAPRHAHEQPYLCLVVAGGFTEQFGARAAECGPGSVVFHPAGEEHADRFGRAGARCFNVQIEPGMAANLERLGGPLRRAAAEGGRVAVAAARLRRPAGETRLVPLQVEAVVLELQETAGGPDERTAPGWLARVVDRLRAGADDPPRVSALAAEEGIHPVYLARTFRRFLGAAPVEYLQGIRLERATLALVRSTMPVARVAADAGFADHSHFCRRFKRAYGLAPTAYRTLMAG
ncbi:MAG TPA: AraC family transcriptional regulator [Gemmatimonadales bacterium]